MGFRSFYWDTELAKPQPLNSKTAPLTNRVLLSMRAVAMIVFITLIVVVIEVLLV